MANVPAPPPRRFDLLRALASPNGLIALLVIAAVVLGATGIGVLFGAGWTLLFLAASSAGLALVLARGVTAGG